MKKNKLEFVGAPMAFTFIFFFIRKNSFRKQRCRLANEIKGEGRVKREELLSRCHKQLWYPSLGDYPVNERSHAYHSAVA